MNRTIRHLLTATLLCSVSYLPCFAQTTASYPPQYGNYPPGYAGQGTSEQPTQPQRAYVNLLDRCLTSILSNCRNMLNHNIRLMRKGINSLIPRNINNLIRLKALTLISIKLINIPRILISTNHLKG